MRLSVPLFLLVISFTPLSLAQHGGGGGGGASSGGSGEGSHGGSSSGGSWSGGSSSGGNSGGHGSGGSASQSAGGGHGSNGGTSHSRSGTSAANGHGRNDTGRFEASSSYISDALRESAALREHLVERALDRMQLDLPGNLKTDHPIPLDLPKHKAQGPANLLVGKPAGKEEKSEERRPAKKPVENKLVCGPGSAGRRCTIPGYHWNLTQGVYDSIEQNCGDLDQRLTREEDKTTPVRVRGMLACLPTPLSPECASASQEVAKADVKIGHLREKYQQCVTRDLHRHARVIISQR